jgi:hypothetical protein
VVAVADGSGSDAVAGFLFAAKPSIGLALLAAYPNRWSLIGAFVFGAATVAFAP